MQKNIIALFLGNLTILYCTKQWTYFLIIVAFFIVLVLRDYKFFAITFIGGILWTLLNLYSLDHQRLQLEYHKRILIKGYVSSIPIVNSFSTQFDFVSESLCYSENCKPKTVKLRLSGYGKMPKPAVGEKWQFQVKLKKPRSLANPGARTKNSYLQEKIIALGSIQKSKDNFLLEPVSHHFIVNQIRGLIQQTITDTLVKSKVEGIIVALSVGITSSISKEQWEIFRKTGTNHLVAISGLHLGIVSSIIFFMAQWLWRRHSFLLLYCPAKCAAAIITLLFAFIYALLAGFSIPTMRALIMTVLIMIALYFRRSVNPIHILLTALLFVIIIKPFSALMPGFWLSFVAVILIFYGIKLTQQEKKRGVRWFKIQLLIFLGLMPFSIVFFEQFSLVAIIANAIAIPIVSFVIVPLCLSAMIVYIISLPLAELLWQLAAYCVQLLFRVLTYLADLSFAVINFNFIAMWQVFIAVAALLILLLPKVLPVRGLTIIWILTLLLVKPQKLDSQQLKFTLLDVGQGLAMVFQTQNHVLIYDTGPGFNGGYDSAQTIILPYLKHLAVSGVDKLIVSHNDNDHSGGALTLIQKFPKMEVYVSNKQPFPESVNLCHRGQHWAWDGVNFEIIYPEFYEKNLSKNNLSCILKVSTGNHSILIPGDIEIQAENFLIEHLPEKLQADILVVPHHGSKTSSSSAFIKQVNPKYALFAVGYRNRYHFPNAKVYERYKMVKRLDTANSGAISFNIFPQNALKMPSEYRKEWNSYWIY